MSAAAAVAERENDHRSPQAIEKFLHFKSGRGGGAASAARAASHMHDGTAWRGVAWQGVRVRRCGVGGSGLLASGFMTDGGGAEIEGARKRKENLTWKDIGAV